MANVINRTTLEYRTSVSTGRFDTADWIINPDLSALSGIDKKYWKVVGDTVVEMTQPEKDAVDATDLAAAKTARIEEVDNNSVLAALKLMLSVDPGSNINSFDGPFAGTFRSEIITGNALKVSINNAANQTALDAITDNRDVDILEA